jgi:hypothetical protein
MSSMAAPSPQAIIPFTAAALRYREKIWTKQWTPTAAPQDLSPPGGAIKSYGYLRTLELLVTTTVAGTSTGSPAFGNADGPWSLFSQVIVTQPNGEEMFGGPTFSGYHAYQAAIHQGWRLNNAPFTVPSYSVTNVLAPQFILPLTFEMDAEHGLGALPNQDFSAPWKLVVTGAASAIGSSGAVYQTAPTTTNPTLQLDVFMSCWTVPSPVNPLNPNVGQETTPALLGTLNKWSLQQYTVPASSAFNVLLQRKGNAIRNFVFIIRNSSGIRLTTAIFPNPFNMKWDGTVIKANDSPTLIVDDEYHTRGGVAAGAPASAAGPVPDVGVMSVQMSDVSGVDAQGVAESYGMNAFWGTVQSSTIEIGGTWGAAAATLEVLTNDVQFVDLAGNPYAFAYGGYLQAPAQPKALP